MTIVRRWDVIVFATGDRQLSDGELGKLGDAVAELGGLAIGAGQSGYGMQLAVAAGTGTVAIATGRGLLTDTAQRIGLPAWTIDRVDARGQGEPAATWPPPAVGPEPFTRGGDADPPG